MLSYLQRIPNTLTICCVMKGAAERMLTNEIVLKVFSDYLNRDTDFEVVLTSKGYTVMGFDCYRQDWNTVDF